MPQPLFTRGDTQWWRTLLLMLILLPPVLILVWLLWLHTTTGAGPIIDQPVTFDHRHHVVDAGIDCTYCHGQMRGAEAGMPSPQLCMRCHNQVLRDAAPLVPVRAAGFEQRPIAWQRVNSVPDFVYFHHGVHVAAGIDCRVCHGEVHFMAGVRQMKPLTMRWCLSCHDDPHGEAEVELPENLRGPRHCSACHR